MRLSFFFGVSCLSVLSVLSGSTFNVLSKYLVLWDLSAAHLNYRLWRHQDGDD